MLDNSDEFEFEFDRIICTDLLLRDHENSSTVWKIDVWEIWIYLVFIFLIK
jgi:hypothetical protein